MIRCDGCGIDFRKSPSKVRAKNFHDRQCRTRHRISTAQPVLFQGYHRIHVGRGYPGADGKGNIFLHRKVMQELLGRALYDDENVHHKNGVKLDNSPDNLELWSTRQPKGQRVEDLVEWAEEILRRYRP